MHRHEERQIVYSPSDLVTFLECRHASFLNVRALDEDMEGVGKDATGELLQKKGIEHEIACMQRLKSEGKEIVEIPKEKAPCDRASMTRDAMCSGVDGIYHGFFFDDFGGDTGWHGEADFLIKCDTPSRLGDFSYEVLDAKMAKAPTSEHIVQLCAYCDFLTTVQGVRPTTMYLASGDGKTHEFRVADFYYYYLRTKERFITHMRIMPPSSYPEPCSYCTFCRWRDRCKEQWKNDDHLSLVANIRRLHMHKLRAAGIQTVADLARTSPDTPISDLNRNTFLRLRSQALLQHHKRTTGKNTYEIIPFSSGKGFYRIPMPDDGDLFFDMEGDPLYPGGLEYLFGVYYLEKGKKTYKAFLAHNHEEEKKAYASFMKFLVQHLAKHPRAHIYHYNHYETTALKRLSCRYAMYEEQMDMALRNHTFVDLYLVVRESIRISEPGYSIKNLEVFYMDKRSEVVATAADSIVVYNKWRETNDQKLLEDVVHYNEMDCVSTHLLRDWLLSLRPEEITWHADETKEEQSKVQHRKEWEIEYEDYCIRLGMENKNQIPLNKTLAHLLEFHNREAKPQWWNSFDRRNKNEDELIEDAECIGALRRYGDLKEEGRSLLYSYRFPPQEYKLKVGTHGVNTSDMKSVGTIVEIDDRTCTLTIKRKKKAPELPDSFSIGPSNPINSDIIRAGIYRCADRVVEEPKSGDVATELLERKIPRIKGKRSGEDIIVSEDVQKDTLEAIEKLDSSYLFIQGPPGSGKTHISSHIVVELLKKGKKIGVTSNSHKAIHNVLKKIEEVATEKGISFRGIKKANGKNKESLYQGKYIHTEMRTKDMSPKADLFAGTAWTLAHPHFEKVFDYLFVDEAGQVATANVVGMAHSTKNIVLVGDQMQLGQPIQGVHPGEAGLSVLDFLLGDEATISAERGIFLKHTRRMRPSICRFISDAFYDGRLEAHESTIERTLDVRNIDLPNEGIVVIFSEHDGCSQKSEIEGEIIKKKYLELLNQSFTDKDGISRGISTDDILVVTPYNVQVNYLRSILPKNAKVGTVDTFQGQEAAIVFVSMVTSSVEYLPRDIEFLYSKHRLNVAISRAQCLAVVVINEKLLEIPCATIEQIKLVNTFCRLDFYRSQKRQKIQ